MNATGTPPIEPHSADDDAAEPEFAFSKPPFIRRVKIRNYKSIAFCDVELKPLTILIGRNGSGKSNFLDALSFFSDVYQLPLLEAVSRRRGYSSICRRKAEEEGISFEIEMGLSSGLVALYSFTIIEVNNFPTIKDDRFCLYNSEKILACEYTRHDGNLTYATINKDFGIEPNNGFVKYSSSVPAQRMLFELFWPSAKSLQLDGIESLISRILLYNFIPENIRIPQVPNPFSYLSKDGSNLASVIASAVRKDSVQVERICDYLKCVVPEISSFSQIAISNRESIRFTQVGGEEFNADSMSDGTLRAIACLTSAFQRIPGKRSPSLVAIEEPETSLHPAATRALVEALDVATQHTQILLTTHSADLIDYKELPLSAILVVKSVNGLTQIGPIHPLNQKSIRAHLYSAAELHSLDQLEIDVDDVHRQSATASQNGLG